MKKMSTGFWLDFRRVFSRRVSGNVKSVLLELVFQPFVVAALVFIAFLNRDKVDPYRLNFLYFSTLYAFWVGLFGSCQAINSEVRSGEWCYWVLGMGRNRTTHVLAIGTSCLLFAFVQCLVFLVAVAALSGIAGVDFCHCPCREAPFNHFVDMFVSIPNGKASVDPICQMNCALWYVLSAAWGSFGPAAFATGIFGLSLLSALISGTCFGLFFGSFFREPSTSLNMAVGFVVLLGMVSLCGLRGDGSEKVDALFAPLHDGATVRATMNRENFASNAVPAAAISYVLPQRYFFIIGRTTFNTEWSDERAVQDVLRSNLVNKAASPPSRKFNPNWTKTMDGANFGVSSGIGKWIRGWGDDYPPPSEQDEKFEDWNEPKPCEMVRFLRNHPEHREGWKVGLHRKILFSTIGLEMLPLLLLNLFCLGATLLSVWKKPCYWQLR